MMEPMICETFLQFRYLSDLGLSPDGRYTAYIRQQANLASNGYDARLWSMTTVRGRTVPSAP